MVKVLYYQEVLNLEMLVELVTLFMDVETPKFELNSTLHRLQIDDLILIQFYKKKLKK